MAIILKSNLYELAASRLERLNLVERSDVRKLGEASDTRASLREKFTADAEKFRAFQDKNVVLGGMHRIRYKEFKHDREPLAIFLNDFKPKIDAVPAINLHYLVKQEAIAAIKIIKRFNAPRLGRGFPPALIWEMVDKFPFKYIPYRLYKLEAIRPLEYIPVADWEEIAQTEISKWQGFRDF